MRKKNVLSCGMVVLILILSPSMILQVSGSRDQPIGRAITKIAEVRVNITYPGGAPAPNINVRVYSVERTYEHYTADHGTTNASGRCIIDTNPYNIGPCIITAYNSSKTDFVSEKVYIGPGEVIYSDIVLTNALPFDREIHGHVLDSSTDEPTPKITTVEAIGYDDEGKAFDVLNTTDDEGYFSLRIPNTISSFSFSASVSNLTTDYVQYDADMFLRDNLPQNDLAIYLTRVDESIAPVSLRFMDSNEGGSFMYPLTYMATGRVTILDHSDTFFSGMTSPFASGWWNTSLRPGEYLMTYSYRTDPPYSTYISFDLPLYVNGTGANEVYGVPLPSLRQVKLRFVDSESSMPVSMAQCSFSYTDRTSQLVMRYSNTFAQSNATGDISFGILPGTSVTVRTSHWNYQTKEISIAPGPVSSPVDMTVELTEPTYIIEPQGNLSIRVIDELSGNPVPLVSLEGVAWYKGIPFYFFGTTDLFGYYNASVTAGTYTIEARSPLGNSKMDGAEVPEKTNTSLIIEIIRNKLDPEAIPVMFRIIDPSGSPIPGAPIIINSATTPVSHNVVSDAYGLISVNLIPGDFLLSSSNAIHASIYRPHWIVPPMTMISVQKGMATQDIVLYEADPLGEISGIVKDIETGDPLPFATVLAESSIDLPNAGTLGPFYPDKVVLYEQEVSSDVRGFFRVWGVGEVALSIEHDGYFPMIDDVTVPDIGHDMLMEELLPYSTSVSGTLVDEGGSPVMGNVSLFDLDRGEYLVNTMETGADGIFSIGTYPGHFRVVFHNLTLSGTTEIAVTDDGIEGLVLSLIAYSRISGHVVNWKGDPLMDVNLTIWSIGFVENVNEGWYITEVDGGYHFDMTRGAYLITIEGNKTFEKYESPLIACSGWTDLELDIILKNRTTGEVNGHVLGRTIGTLSPLIGCEVVLMDGNGSTISTANSGTEGSYFFPDLAPGSYRVFASPRAGTEADERFFIDGYLSNSTSTFDVATNSVTKDIVLEYMDLEPSGYMDLIGFFPIGTDVSLDEPMRLWFSEAVNITDLLSAFEVTPVIDNMTFILSWDGVSLQIEHGSFIASTTYHIRLLPKILSMSGHPLRGIVAVEWNFTTGSGGVGWRILSSLITIYPNKNWTISSVGPKDQDVFFIVKGIGSFELAEIAWSKHTSYYNGSLTGALFNWSELYLFHYSDRKDGPNMAVDFSGYRMMPDEKYTPPIEWKLYGAGVKLNDEGDWLVNATGNANVTVYIVIDRIGSFLMGQVTPGIYLLTIPASNFQGGTEYSYHFSNVSGGNDLAPRLAGTVRALSIEEDNDGGGSLWWVCLVLLGSALLVLAIAVIGVSLKKRPMDEVEDWGLEE